VTAFSNTILRYAALVILRPRASLFDHSNLLSYCCEFTESVICQNGGFLTMVKLTVELIEQAAQYTNPVRDRELDLRGA
jgi:Leucine-rich repeat